MKRDFFFYENRKLVVYSLTINQLHSHLGSISSSGFIGDEIVNHIFFIDKVAFVTDGLGEYVHLYKTHSCTDGLDLLTTRCTAQYRLLTGILCGASIYYNNREVHPSLLREYKINSLCA